MVEEGLSYPSATVCYNRKQVKYFEPLTICSLCEKLFKKFSSIQISIYSSNLVGSVNFRTLRGLKLVIVVVARRSRRQ